MIRLRPISKKIALAPFKLAIRAGKKANCSGIKLRASWGGRSGSAVGHEKCQAEHYQRKQKQSCYSGGQREGGFHPGIKENPECFDPVGERVEIHKRANPRGSLGNGKQGAR